MGAVISEYKKIKSLPFIRANLHKLSQRAIAKKLSLGKTTVNRWAKEIGFVFKKHTVNENFFRKLDQDSSYILGFIFADGNIAWNSEKGYYSMTITASAKDKEHLEKIRNMMMSTKPLLYSQNTNSYRMIVNNKTLCKSLMQWGVTPRKSLTIKFPNIPQKQLRHFIRGVIDGDGNVRYVNRKRSPYFEITVASGSKDFSKGLVNAIKNELQIDATIRKVNGANTYIMQYSCYRGEKLAGYIYFGANLFLKRKYLAYRTKLLGGK